MTILYHTIMDAVSFERTRGSRYRKTNRRQARIHSFVSSLGYTLQQEAQSTNMIPNILNKWAFCYFARD